jgi:hypothetical protein
MKKEDLMPACLQLLQDDRKYRAALRVAMPLESHQTFDEVEKDGMFLPNGMLTPAAHALIKELNAALPIVEASLSSRSEKQIAKRASSYRVGVEERRDAHAKSRKDAPPGLMKRASSLAKAIGSETKAIAKRQANLTPDQVAARLVACRTCDQLRPNRTCAKCGCFVDGKARFRTQDCPLGKWPKK